MEDEDDGEPFNLPGSVTLGILGGKGVGKSYLFSAMVYRSYSPVQAGAMSRFVESTRLFHASHRNDRARTLSLSDFMHRYIGWDRLPQTVHTNQSWYRLRLNYRTGLLGRSRSHVEVNFFDGSGEGFFEASRTRGLSQLWREGYLNARVMVFCLPIWVAFPGGLSRSDWQQRREALLGFERVIQNYDDMRRESKLTHPVRSILVLTMADDRRSALTTLYERWIAPYLDSPETYLQALRSGSGVTQYLAEAQRVSAALHGELSASSDPRVGSIPYRLNFGNRPWVIPTSAIQGSRLDRIEREYGGSMDRPELPAPVPAHVELPLLVALCESTNALM
jgi:GTPase SAR1 family protein